MCISYITIDKIPFPCGKCYECLDRRIRGWAFRLIKQAESSDSAFFLTLTYHDSVIPLDENSQPTLYKKDVQLFIKRLRKAHPKTAKPIKYFAAGEYGSKTDRPHYHIIMFNADKELVLQKWELGNPHFGEVNEATIYYTLKYISKGITVPCHEEDLRNSEFQLMSKGLGENYLTPQMKRWHKNKKVINERLYIEFKDRHKSAMPRYYKEKIYTKLQRQQIGKYQSETNVDNLTQEQLQEQHLIRINKARTIKTKYGKDKL